MTEESSCTCGYHLTDRPQHYPAVTTAATSMICSRAQAKKEQLWSPQTSGVAEDDLELGKS